MKYLITLLFCSAIILYSCDNKKNSNNNSTEVVLEDIYNSKASFYITDKIDDGIYLIINTWEDSSLISPSIGKVISFSHDFLEGNKKNQPLFIEVETSEFVPMSLSKKPQGIEQKDKRINLFLNMTDSASIMLEHFTEKNLNKRVCIVVGGKAVTMHKVREKISGGKLQIIRCTDNACQHLLFELEDNVENSNPK